MKLVNHGAKLQLWELDAERSRISETVHRSGLAPLISCSHRVASRPMLSAFCERWQSETTTFHLPFGEMTITVDDVASIFSHTYYWIDDIILTAASGGRCQCFIG